MQQTYWPALDGLRAISVVMVLCFHQGFMWMTGGYIGVSVFFTLSGFLITTLLIAEFDESGRISLGDFYARRLRRLLPASLSCLVGVAIVARLGGFSLAEDLEMAVLAALGQVANWEMLLGGSRIGNFRDFFSPTAHFWSLAIEEQFYLLWPITLAYICSRAPRHRSRVIVVGAFALAGVAAAPIVARVFGPDAAYWSTPARLGEVMMGALLAVVSRGGKVPERHHRMVVVLGIVAAAGIVVAAVFLPKSGGPAFSGWLGVGSVLSCGVVASALIRGPMTTLLSSTPLVMLGRVSYGVYLYHWPIFLLIATGNSSIAIFLVRVTVTLALASASYVWLERPIRLRRSSNGSTGRVAGLSVAAVALAVVMIVPSAPR